jgi:hypothetical protein
MVDMAEVKIIPLLAALLMLVASCAPVTPAPEFSQGAPVPVTVGPATSASVLPRSPAVPVTVEPTATVPAGPPQTDADVPRVSVEDAAAAIQSGEAVILDVRSAQAYQASHIPGALSIPLAQIETNPAGLSLDKAKWIITYCT